MSGASRKSGRISAANENIDRTLERTFGKAELVINEGNSRIGFAVCRNRCCALSVVNSGDLANLEGVGAYTAWVKNSSKVPYAASPHKSQFYKAGSTPGVYFLPEFV